MKLLKSISSALVLSAASSLAAFAGDVIFNPLLSAVPSLTIAPDARAGSMGDIGVASSPDLNSQYWNPAKYAQISGQGGASLSYTPWLRKIVNDIDLVYLAGYYKIGETRAVSASLRYFSYGDIELTKMPNAMGEVISDGTAKPYEMAVDLAYSQMLSEYWSAAVAMRFILSDITNGMSSDGSSAESGKAVAADVAAYYRRPTMLFGRDAVANFGVNISNIGSKISYDGGDTEEFIPTNLRIGGGLEYSFDQYSTLALMLDLNKLLVPTAPVSPEKRENESDDDFQQRREDYEDDYKDYTDKGSIAGIFSSFGDAPGGFSEELDEIMWSVGLEYTYNKMFMVRGGYFHESESKGNRKYFSIGAGFKMSVIDLNLAYLISTSQSNPLDKTLRVSLGFNIDGLKELAED